MSQETSVVGREESANSPSAYGEEGAKVPEVDAKEYGFRWYPIRDTALEPMEKGEGEEVRTVTRAFILKKAPRNHGTPTRFEENPDMQRFVAIVSERYVVLPNEYVTRVVNGIARKMRAAETTRTPPNFEREWYLHKEFVLPDENEGLGKNVTRGFIVENAVNRSHALVVSPTVTVDGTLLVAGSSVRSRLLKNTQGRRVDYRRHTKNMVEETLETLVTSAVEASEVWSQHIQWLSDKTVGDFPHVIQELLKMRQKPLPNKVYPDILVDTKGNVTISPDSPEKWPVSLTSLPLLSLYTSVAAQVRALESNEERKTGLLEALAQPFAAADMLAWINHGART